jgi:hypothetical protein
MLGVSVIQRNICNLSIIAVHPAEASRDHTRAVWKRVHGHVDVPENADDVPNHLAFRKPNHNGA